jgi:hypothetical protein
MAEIRRWAIVQANSAYIWRARASAKACDSKGFHQKTPIKKKRAAGIEPASSAWKAEVLPLNYARSSSFVLPGPTWWPALGN